MVISNIHIDDSVLGMYVITEGPSDFPGKFVAKRYTFEKGVATPDAEPSVVADTLGEVQNVLSRYEMVCLPRHPKDPEVIVEVWL